MGRDISPQIRLCSESHSMAFHGALWCCPEPGRVLGEAGSRWSPCVSTEKLGWCCGTTLGAAWSRSGCPFPPVPHVGAGHVLWWSPGPGEARTGKCPGPAVAPKCTALQEEPSFIPPPALLFPPLFKFISLRQPGLSLLENYSDKSSLSSNYLNGGKGGEIHLESTSLRD